MKAPDARVVLGKSGSGKTHLIAQWLDQLGGRQIVFDPAAQLAYENRRAVVVETAGEVLDIMRTDARAYRILWRGVTRDSFDQVNRYAWAAENVTVVWEEVDSLWRAAETPEWAMKLVNQGRHRDVRVIACARRPARVSRDLTANASRIVAFRTVEPRDLAYFAEFVGPEAVATLRGLAKWHALDWTETGSAVKKSPFP